MPGIRQQATSKADIPILTSVFLDCYSGSLRSAEYFWFLYLTLQ